VARESTPADFFIKFGGTHPQVDVDEPKLGEMVEYTIYGQIVSVGDVLRKDGETRHTVAVDVEAAWPKGTKRPDTANQAAMTDAEGNINPEARPDGGGEGELISTDASADEGDEIVAARAEAKAAKGKGNVTPITKAE
jgi:hypothetical protein